MVIVAMVTWSETDTLKIDILKFLFYVFMKWFHRVKFYSTKSVILEANFIAGWEKNSLNSKGSVESLLFPKDTFYHLDCR